MNSLGRRQKEREAVRTKILDAARELFATQGFEAVSMRKIAERIDYTATAIYTHFKDKEALLNELCDTDFRSLRMAFARIGKIADPIERLRALGEAYVGFAASHPNHYRLMFLTVHPERDPSESQIAHGDPDEDAYAFLKSIVAEAIATGLFREEFRDADQVAQIIWANVHGLVALHLTKGKKEWFEFRPLKDSARLGFEITMRGLRRDPS
jgi:AcrR family transcriptional regulator